MARDNIDAAVRSAILGVSGVSAVLGTRVYADDAVPQSETFPYAILTMIGDAARMYSLNGGAMQTFRARYQVDVYGLTKADVRSLRSLITARRQDGGLDGFQGTWGTGGESVYVQVCKIDNRRNGTELLQEGSERYVYFAGCDLEIVFNE